MRRLRAVAPAWLRHRWHPPRPPIEPPERVRALAATAPGDAFITGNALAARCRYVLNYDALTVNDDVDNEWWFCKADWLEHFFGELAPDEPFVLLSHNSDRPIDRRFGRALRRRNLVAWFAANAALRHPRLFSIPLGIANPVWPHGDSATLEAVRRLQLPKTRLVDASFRVETNPSERRECLERAGVEPDEPLDFAAYLERLASSYFSLSPAGNGIDAHRTWEALYVRTVPIVRRSVLTDQHPELPLLVVDEWKELGSIELSPDLYARIWGEWEPEALRLDRYLRRIESIVASCSGRRGDGPPGAGERRPS